MRRHNGSDFLTPLTSAGAEATRSATGGRGYFTLTAGTYYVPIGVEDTVIASVMSQWGATGTITSITVEESDAPDKFVTDYAASAGNWFAVDTSRITSAVNGAGTSTNTNDVIAHTAAGAGGAIQNVQDSGARRMRLVIVVATTVDMRFFAWGQG